MVQARIMYWKEIPVQVKATDEHDEVTKMFDARFQEAVDAVAMMDGSSTTDEYLNSWQWGEMFESEGTAATVADEVAQKFNLGMPADFVAKIRDLHKSNGRNSSPGAIDHWLTKPDKQG